MPGRRAEKTGGLRIVHIVRYWHHYGGVETVAEELAKKQAKEGHEVHVVTTLPTGKPKKVLGVTVHSLPYYVLFNEPVYRVYPELVEIDPDIIHEHYPNPWGFLWAWLYAVLHKKKLRITYHAQAGSSTLAAVLNRIFDLLFYPMVLMARAELIYTHSRIGPKIPGSRVELSQPVDTRKFRPIVPLEKREYDIGYVGRLTKLKRVDWILKAAAKVNKEMKIIIIGDGPEKENLEKLAKELGLKHIKFTGRVKHEELPKYYNQIKTLVLPSKKEGLPVSILEAKACGCRVLATPVGGVPDIVEKASLFKGMTRLQELLTKEKEEP